MTKLQLLENINTFKQSILHSGDNKRCGECWNLKKIFLSGAMHLAGFPVTKWVISNKKWLIARGMRFYSIPSKWRSGAESSTHVTNRSEKGMKCETLHFPTWSFSPLKKLTSGVAVNGGRKPRQREQRWGSLRVRRRTAPCHRGRTSQALVTQRAPRDSRTQAQKSARSGLCPTAGAPGRRARVSSGTWKLRGAGFLWLSSWDWTHWRARLFSCAYGEKKLPLDLVGPMPLSSRGCLMPPSHLFSNGPASRWGRETTSSWKAGCVTTKCRVPGSAGRGRAEQGGWSCGPGPLPAWTLPDARDPRPAPRPGPSFSPASSAANLQNAGQSKLGLGAPRLCSSRKAEGGWGLGRGYQNRSEAGAAMTVLGWRETPKAGSLL